MSADRPTLLGLRNRLREVAGPKSDLDYELVTALVPEWHHPTSETGLLLRRAVDAGTRSGSVS